MKNPSHIKFTKMHGLGNDFIIIDTTQQTFFNLAKFPIQQLSHRYTGIGFDQALIIGTSNKANYSCRFFNADGSEAEQCGNGVRCVARFLHENGLLSNNQLTIETKAGIIAVVIHDYEHIQVSLGTPVIEADKKIQLDNSQISYSMSVLSMGNPHAILQVKSVNDAAVQDLGQQIATHPDFPKGVNVGFMEIVTPEQILLRTYERGVGETLACGSNACAAVVAGITNRLLKNIVTVSLALGQLQIAWSGENSAVTMTGPASRVFEGVLSL